MKKLTVKHRKFTTGEVEDPYPGYVYSYEINFGKTLNRIGGVMLSVLAVDRGIESNQRL